MIKKPYSLFKRKCSIFPLSCAQIDGRKKEQLKNFARRDFFPQTHAGEKIAEVKPKTGKELERKLSQLVDDRRLSSAQNAVIPLSWRGLKKAFASVFFSFSSFLVITAGNTGRVSHTRDLFLRFRLAVLKSQMHLSTKIKIN